MALRIPNRSRNAGLDAITALANTGPGPGYVEIRTGAQPADPDDAASGTLLATIPCNDPAFTASGLVTDGVASADITPALTAAAVATGAAGWARAYDSTGASWSDRSVSATGGSGQLQLNTVDLVNGVDVTITAWSITFPAA